MACGPAGFGLGWLQLYCFPDCVYGCECVCVWILHYMCFSADLHFKAQIGYRARNKISYYPTESRNIIVMCTLAPMKTTLEMCRCAPVTSSLFGWAPDACTLRNCSRPLQMSSCKYQKCLMLSVRLRSVCMSTGVFKSKSVKPTAKEHTPSRDLPVTR